MLAAYGFSENGSEIVSSYIAVVPFYASRGPRQGDLLRAEHLFYPEARPLVPSI